jgi:hypothetical protein
MEICPDFVAELRSSSDRGPMESAWALHRAWPEDRIVTPDSGHISFNPPNIRAFVASADKFAGLASRPSAKRPASYHSTDLSMLAIVGRPASIIASSNS